MPKPRHILFLLATAVLLFGCRKDEQFTDSPSANVSPSEDTVLFDTIFTTVGSVTKRFTVRNPNDNAVRMDVTLEGGTASPFRINVDGASGTTFHDVEILGHDSLYIFVEATLNASNQNNPFIFEDHILLNTNGNEKRVLLLAWGQDAHFFHPDHAGGGFPNYSIIPCGAHWTNDKPYVIYGYAVVDSACLLTIDPGVRVYFHGGAGLWVYRGGRILAEGTVQDRITFQGDRLEPQYADLPNQWDRIWINEGPAGADNELKNCVIKNALIGVQAQTFPLTADQPLSDNRLLLNNVSIRNCLTAGLYSENYRITSTNLQAGDAGQYAVVLTGSGEYHFDHPTIANYWSFDVRQDPAFLLTNSFTDVYGNAHTRPIAASDFRNGVAYGNNTKEFKIDVDEAPGTTFTFDHFLVRTDEATNDGSHFPDQSTIYRNIDPGFVDGPNGDLHLNANAPARNRGITTPTVQDFDDKFYGGLDGTFAIGCYEYFP